MDKLKYKVYRKDRDELIAAFIDEGYAREFMLALLQGPEEETVLVYG